MYTGRKYYFITIAETLNITQAARTLMVSQPSLTQYLNKLEKDLEVMLVDRSFTPLRLTQAGQLYYEYLVKMRKDEEALQIALQKLKNQSQRPLMIGIPLQKSHELIRRVLPRFVKEQPDISVSIWEGTSSTVRERVIKGELDIGFGHMMEESDSDCVVHHLSKEKILIICNRANPIVAGRESSPSQPLEISPQLLSSQHFYQMSKEYYLYEVESEDMLSHGISPVSRTVMSNLIAIIDTIISMPDSGFAYMPDYVMNEAWPRSVSSRLAYLRVGDSNISWYFSMMRKRGHPQTMAAKAFWNSVVTSRIDTK